MYQMQSAPVKYMTREQYTEYYNNGTLYDTKFHEENIIKPVSTDMRPNEELQVLKGMERDFERLLEDCVEDLVAYEREVEPYGRLSKAFDYHQRTLENRINMTQEENQK